MKNKIIIFVFFLSTIIIYSQEIRLVDITYKNDFQYFTFYNNKTIIADEIDSGKNISLFTDDIETKFKSFVKCKKKNCYQILDESILISWDFNIPSQFLIKDKILNKIKTLDKNYIDNLAFNQKVLAKKRGYTLYSNDFKNVLIVVLEMSKAYYNKYSNDMKLCETPNDKIILYRVINTSDEELYFK